jgi:DNA invertase Pin-like site-specific DNA recombinase
LNRVEANGVEIILIWNATRLARDLMVGEVILQQLTDAGCTVIAADSGTDLTADSDDPTRRLIRQVLDAVAEFDRRVTVMKLRAARQGKLSRGQRCEGRKPFGTFPGVTETMARIRELRGKPPHGRRPALQQLVMR